MKASIEHLYHFSCDSCSKWWSIGDFPWGSQPTLWCPWCGHQNTLPSQPMTGDDFATEHRAMTNPNPGQIYRHRKHNPEAGKWHEYEVVGVVQPGTPALEGTPPYTATHTETGEQHGLIKLEHPSYEHRVRWYASPELKCSHVCYKSTRDNSGKYWLRPLDMFTDGRFTLIP